MAKVKRKDQNTQVYVSTQMGLLLISLAIIGFLAIGVLMFRAKSADRFFDAKQESEEASVYVVQ